MPFEILRERPVPVSQADTTPSAQGFEILRERSILPTRESSGSTDGLERSDYGRMVMSGFASMGAGIGWLGEKLGQKTGIRFIENLGRGLKEAGRDAADAWINERLDAVGITQEGLSPAARRALEVEFLGEGAFSDKWNKAKLLAAASLPATTAGMAGGGVIARGLALAGMPAAGAAAIGYGLGEAGIAAPMAGESTEAEVLAMDPKELRKSPEFQAAYESLSGLPERERVEKATRLVADAAAGKASALTLLSTFVLSAPAGAILKKFLPGANVGTGRIAGAVKDAATEGAQEFFQSGAEALSQNIALREAGIDRDLWDNVLEEAVGGALSGAPLGAAMGFVAPEGDEDEEGKGKRHEEGKGKRRQDGLVREGERMGETEEVGPITPPGAVPEGAVEADIVLGAEEGAAEPEIATEPEPVEEVARFQFMKRDSGHAPQMEVLPLTQERFLRYVRPYMAEGTPGYAATVEEFQAKNPEHTHIALVRSHADDDWRVHRTGPREALTHFTGDLARQVRPVEAFDSPAAQEWARFSASELARKAPGTIDPKKDSLLAAISKLGGLNRQIAEAEGVDPAEFGRRGAGINRVFTQGGRTPEELAEILQDYGYPVVDETGTFSGRELMERVFDELSGRFVMSSQGIEAAAEREAREREAYEARLAREERESDLDPDYEQIAAELEALAYEPEYPPDFDDDAKSLADLAMLAREYADEDAVEDALMASTDAQAARELWALIRQGREEVPDEAEAAREPERGAEPSPAGPAVAQGEPEPAAPAGQEEGARAEAVADEGQKAPQAVGARAPRGRKETRGERERPAEAAVGAAPKGAVPLDVERLRQVETLAIGRGKDEIKAALDAIDRGADRAEIKGYLENASTELFQQQPELADAVDKLIGELERGAALPQGPRITVVESRGVAASRFTKGQRVQHPKWGVGTVIGRERDDLRVRFDDGTTVIVDARDLSEPREAVDRGELMKYAEGVVGGDVESVTLVGSATTRDDPNDIDLVYKLDIELPEDQAGAEAAVEAAIERSNIDLDRYDTFIQVGDRYFHVSSGAGRGVVENTEYGREQRGRPAEVIARRPQEKPKKQAPTPSPNRIFTEEAAAKAREILRKKLGQINTGIDPEIMQAGITLAGYHIERGARTFAAYVEAMTADLGDIVRPYLKSWYMAVKYDPRAAEFAAEMDDAATVEAADVEALTAEAPSEEPPARDDALRDRVYKAREELQREYGYDNHPIQRVHARVGGPLEALKNELLAMHNEGRVELVKGDAAYITAEDRAAAIPHPKTGEPMTRVELRPRPAGETERDVSLVEPQSSLSESEREALRDRIYKAHKEVADDKGYPDVLIYEVFQKVGGSLEDFKAELLAMSREGLVIPGVGDWSLSSPEERQAALIIDGHPHLRIRLKPRATPGPTQAEIEEAAHAAATSPKNDLPQPTQAQKEANGEGNYKLGDPVKLYGVTWRVENPKGSYRFKFDEAAFEAMVMGTKGDWTATTPHEHGGEKGKRIFVQSVLALLREGSIPSAFRMVRDAVKKQKVGTGDRRAFRDFLEASWYNKMPAHYARARDVEGADGDKLDAFLGPRSADQSLPVYVIDTKKLSDGSFDEHKVMIGFESEEAARKTFLDSYSGDIGPKILGAITTMSPAEFEGWVRSDRVKKPAAEAQPEPMRLARFFAQRFAAGERFSSIVAARRAASELLGRKIGPGTVEAKMVDEAVELGATMRAREIAQAGGEPREVYQQLVDLYERMPKLSTRTSTSVAQQAYSTPLPLAYVAARAAGITPDSTVYEPTAGNGALLLTANPKPGATATVVANEINEARAANLLATLPDAQVTKNDAAEWRPRGQFDVIIGNPPFGVVKEEGGRTRRFQVNERYETSEIDHAISLKALEAMKDDGAAVLIVGSVAKTARSPEARSDAYNAKAKREFYLTLYGQYNVVDHFTVAGELYEKQGAGWPVDVIVIRGRGRSARPVPAVEPPRIYDSWEALAEVLDARYEDAPGGVRPSDRARDRGEPEPEAGDGRDRRGGGEGRPDRQQRPAAPREPDSVREGSLDREPGDARPPEPASRGPARAEAREESAGRPRSAPIKIEGENARQVAYQPASRSAPMGTLVPVNMQTAIQDALAALEARVGDIDAFVADRLGYPQAELSNYFGAEQVDALALALDNMERGAGFIIGDQTGIGKGRVVAAIIRYAIRNGRVPIFVTEKPNLYGDMYRDMTDIGLQDMLGRDVRILMTNASQTVPLDDEGKKTLKTGPAGAHNKLLTEIADSGQFKDYDVIFTTYSQMQTVKGDVTPRMQFLERMAQGGIVIFDESHNAGGSVQPSARKDDKEKEELNRAIFARKLTRIAHGVFYSSATYAKRPEVMDLYASTDMRLAVADIDNLAPAIQKGGVPMQQVVAAMLSGAGQYIRRERSFDGVVYNAPVVSVPRETYGQYCEALAAIQRFSEVYIPGVVKLIDRELKAEGKSISVDGSTGGAGAASTNFTAIMHNLIDQMLLAITADAAADKAIEALKNNEKPVITVANTMGSFIQDYVEGREINPGDKIDIDFNTLLVRYLERTRQITIRRPFMRKGEKGEKHYITDAELGPLGVRVFNETLELIQNMDFSALPVSPIDHIRRRLADAGYTVGEITGRQHTLDYRKDGAYYRVRSSKETSIKGRRQAIAGFNSGKIDAMILNQAGSTGLSLHASRNFKDQRKRRMIIAQAEKNIDTHMQMLGRVHRTGQVVPPEYDQLVPDVPAVKRPAAVLAKKMASLNANTTASRGGALTAENVPDFLNQYGDEVVARVMAEMPDVHRALGRPLNEEDDGFDSKDAARKVTGRIPLLPLDQQEQLYELIESEYREYVAQKEAAGESILEAKTLPLDAKVLDRKQVVAPQGGTSPFADGVYVEVVDVKRLGKPHTTAEVLAMAAESLGVDVSGADGDPVVELERLRRLGVSASERTVADAEQEFKAYRSEVLDDIEKPETRMATATRLDGQLSRFKELMAVVYVGQSVRLESNSNVIYGVVTKVERRGQAKNPLALSAWKVTIATADSSRKLNTSLSQLDTARQVGEVSTRMTVSPATDIMEGLSVIQAFDELQTEAREVRTIITGNLLAGFEHVGGRGAIINFTDADGNVRQGILMRRGYDYQKDQSEKPVPLRTAEQVIAFVEMGYKAVSADRDITVTANAGAIRIEIAAAKGRGGKYFLDPGVLRALGGDFVKVGNFMRADVPRSQAPAVLEALRRVGAGFQAVDNLREARKVAGEVTAATTNVELRRGAEAVRGKGLGVRIIKPFVDDIIRNWRNAPAEVVVTTRATMSQVPEHVRREIESMDPTHRAMGAHDRAGRRVFLFADNIPSLHEAERVLVHEIKGHYGTQAFLGDQYREFANMVFRKFPDLAVQEARRIRADLRKAADRMRVADEMIARIAERIEAKTATAAMLRVWDRFYTMFVRALRALGIRHYEPTQAELRNIVREASRWVERGERGAAALPDVTAGAPVNLMVAYHGSPYVFDRFSTAHVGTGEGAQAFGWGLYFAENKKVAETYHAALSERVGGYNTFDGRQLTPQFWSELQERRDDPTIEMLLGFQYASQKSLPELVDETIRTFEGALERWKKRRKEKRTIADEEAGYTDTYYREMIKSTQERLDLLRGLRSRVGYVEPHEGAVYDVEIPDEVVGRMLDWDAPVDDSVRQKVRGLVDRYPAEQSAGLRAALENKKTTGGGLYGALVVATQDESGRAASEALAGIGIPGIKYLDHGSRGTGSGTRNLVLFDDSLVKILRVNGQPVERAREAVDFLTDPANNVQLEVLRSEEEQRRQSRFLAALKAGQPLDRAFRLPFTFVGTIDERGVWHVDPRAKAFGRKVAEEARRLMRSKRFRWLHHIAGVVHAEVVKKYGIDDKVTRGIEAAKKGLIDRYGLDKEYIARDYRRQADERGLLLQARDTLKLLLDQGVGPKEAEVLYRMLTGEEVTDEHMSKLAEPIRQAIDQLGAEAVELGFISREAYERNRGAYLHRSYMLYESQKTGLARFAGDVLKARRRRIIGEQFKGRGMFIRVKSSRVQRDMPEWWGKKTQAKKADASLIGQKILVLDKVAAPGLDTVDIPGMDPKKVRRRVVQRVYWPASEPLPAKFNGWESRGKFEVRDVVGDELVLWRDFTKEERERMGEIVDARYAIAKTYMQMAHDLATGRFFRDIASNPDWARKDDPTGGRAEDAKEGRLAKVLDDAEWVRVPTTKIPKSNAYRYGALAGMYVRAEIWRDLEELQRMQKGGFWREVMRQWKLNKALALDTPIPTPSGWTTMGEIRVGDQVFDERGNVCTVLEVKDIQHGRPCFEVVFSDGTKIIADDEHWWYTEHRTRGPGVRTTREIRETLTINHRGEAAHSISVAGPLDLPEADLPLPPYAFGLWLGDGHSSAPRITVGAQNFEEIRRSLEGAGVYCGKPGRDKRSTAVTFTVDLRPIGPGRDANLFKEGLESLGVLGSKRIPTLYLRASIEQRRALLAGLMDADGWITSRGTCGFATSLESLRDDVLELLRSLGYKPTVSEVVSRSGAPAWRVHFQAYADAPVFRVSAKRDRLRQKPETRQRSRTRQIVAVNPVPSVPVRCIAVSSPSKLYLAGEGMVPTHNTARNPVVHLNNIMSNIMLMDLIDVRGRDFVRGFRSYTNQDSYYRLAVQYGALGSDFLSQEIRDDVLKPILRELEREQLDQQSRTGLWGATVRVATMGRNVVRAFDEKWRDWYRLEDELFRMAVFIRELERGVSPEVAAMHARDQMLNYDIRAPWINALRESVLPFIAYTYRAIPVIARSVADRPWKIAKYATVAYMLNALSYLFTGGDEDEERAALRENERGRTWLGVYRMIRTPFEDQWGNPIFLDVRRWIPAGDVFDFNQGSSALPIPAPFQFGGPLMIGMELMLNRAAFTGEDIVDPLVDTPTEKAAKWGDFLWKSFAPSAPWVPGSWYYEKIVRAATGELDPLMREYSVPLAIVSSFGLKLKPHDLALQRRYLMMEMDAIERRLNEQLAALQRDFARQRIDREYLEEQIEEIMEKRRRLAEERAKLAPR